MQLFTWFSCLVKTLTDSWNHPNMVITIVMPTKLEETGAQRWISWKQTTSLGKLLHIDVMLQTATNITTSVIEEDAANSSMTLVLMHMDTEDSTESILQSGSMLKSNSILIQQVDGLMKLLFSLVKDLIVLLLLLLIQIVLTTTLEPWEPIYLKV